MNDKTMARADFFKYVAGKAASLISEVTGDFVKPLNTASDVVFNSPTKPLLPVDEHNGEPKLLTSSKPPIFLVGKPFKDLTAISALCANDTFLLSYEPHDDSLNCYVCGAKHVLNRTEDGIKTDLKTFPLAINEGYICLLSGS